MRVAHLVPHLEDNGNGVVTAFMTLAQQQLRDPNYSLAVISRGGSLASHLTPEASLFTLPKAVSEAKRRQVMTEYLSEWQPDIIHVHTVGMLAHILGTRVKHAIPTVTTAHSLFRRKEYLMLLANATVAVSQKNATRLKRIALRPDSVTTIYNAVESPSQCESYDAEQRFQNDLLFVGGLFERKGVHVLLEAVRLLHAHGMLLGLNILGNGPQRQALEDQVRRLHLEPYVTFHGFVSDPGNFYREASALVHPALEEPFGLVLAEAEQYGLPIIASNAGGISEVLANGKAGTLVSPGNAEELARAIHAVLASPSTAQRWSDKSAQIGRDWRPSKMFLAYDALYRQTILRRRHTI